MVFSSPRHLLVAAGCIIVMEIVYKMDFSLLGFLVCAAILGIGMMQSFFFSGWGGVRSAYIVPTCGIILGFLLMVRGVGVHLFQFLSAQLFLHIGLLC